MLSVSYAGKNAYSTGKTNGVLRDGASAANRFYVLVHCSSPMRTTDSDTDNPFIGDRVMADL